MEGNPRRGNTRVPTILKKKKELEQMHPNESLSPKKKIYEKKNQRESHSSETNYIQW